MTEESLLEVCPPEDADPMMHSNMEESLRSSSNMIDETHSNIMDDTVTSHPNNETMRSPLNNETVKLSELKEAQHLTVMEELGRSDSNLLVEPVKSYSTEMFEPSISHSDILDEPLQSHSDGMYGEPMSHSAIMDDPVISHSAMMDDPVISNSSLMDEPSRSISNIIVEPVRSLPNVLSGPPLIEMSNFPIADEQILSSRPQKNSRRSICSSRAGDMFDAQQLIMDPSIDSPGYPNEGDTSMDYIIPSPSKQDDSLEVCALCNCGSEMALILGQLTQYPVSPSTLRKMEKIKSENSKDDVSDISSSDTATKELRGKVFIKRRRRRDKLDFDSNLPPDMTTFGTAKLQEFTDIIDANGNLWAHHCCAAWSAGVCQTDSYHLENVDRAVGKALLKKCSHCQRYGASVECQVHRCNKLFHYPCCASAGAFQNITSMILLCPDHLDRTEKLADADASCDECQKTENLNLQLFCTSCGRHYHSYCVEMTIPITPVVRMGWQCSHCKVCQGCKQPGDEDKMLCCDHCDKGYHTYCLNPPISVIPKSVWKCVSCRKCDDCGATRAGGGPSCRWHNNFTLCDRCYQQRKKGQCCPVCTRAVRLYSNVDVLQCVKCFKCIHSECDPDGGEADKYVCCMCLKGETPFAVLPEETNDSVSSYDYDLATTGQRQITMEEAELYSLAASADFMKMLPIGNEDFYEFSNKVAEIENKYLSDEKLSESTIGSPHSSFASENFTDPHRREGFNRRLKKPTCNSRRKGSVFEIEPPVIVREPSIVHTSVESPDSTSLAKTVEVINVDADAPEDDDDGDDDDREEGLHSTVVIVSNSDSFTLKQDICMCCGSFGKGSEGYLIGCVQCGQCFHPFCVNVKVNEVILKRGWRCLDCTVCEGCGRNADEAHLLLCDICDISFHIYCLDPPLDEVPVGGWKCRWCAFCEDCGSKEPGFGSMWMANYTQCGPCSSEQYCSICSYAYEPNNLVIQCEKCKRWLHAECDGIFSEDDAQLACTMVYHCSQCRPKTKHLGIYSNLKTSAISKQTVRKALSNNVVTSTSTSHVRKTKTLHNLKTKKEKAPKAEKKELKPIELDDTLPLVPTNVSANELGTFTINLDVLKSRLPNEEPVKEKLLLTEDGMKQIKSQVIRAPIHRSAIRKDRRKKEEIRTSTTMSEETCGLSESLDDSGQAVTERIDGVEEAEATENSFSMQDMVSVKQEESTEMELMNADVNDEASLDGHPDEGGESQEPEDQCDPFEFFGVDLLEKHLHMELESLGLPDKRKKIKKERKREKRMKKAAKLAEAAARIAPNTTIGPSVPDLTAVITEIVTRTATSTPAVTSPPPVSKTLTDIVLSPETVRSDRSGHTSPLTSTTSLEVSGAVNTCISENSMSPNNFSNMKLFDDQINVKDHEMEQLVPDKIPPPPDIQQMEKNLQAHLSSIQNSAMPPILNYSNTLSSHAPHLASNAPPHLPPAPQHVPSSHHSSSFPHPLKSDAFQSVFGEESKEKEEDVHTKIDTQKQLRKWELDEKLGEDASISPVLYANINHAHLKEDYKDWPNRARAIARLWRKLPSEERQPYRLKARDNRVKLKEKKSASRELAKAQQRLLSGKSQRGSLNRSPYTSPQPIASLPAKAFSSEPPAYSFSPPITTNPMMTTPANEINQLNVSSPNILTVPEPQKLSPLLLSPAFSASSFSALSSPMSSMSYQTSITSPIEQIPKPVVKPPKPKVSRPRKESKAKKMQNASLHGTSLPGASLPGSSLPGPPLLGTSLQEQEKQWKLLQHQRQFEQERQAILKASKPDRQPIHPSARFSATLNSSLGDELSHPQTFPVKALLQDKVTSPELFPNRLPITSPVTPLNKKDDIDDILFSNVQSGKPHTPSVSSPTFSLSSVMKNAASCYPNAIKSDLKSDKTEKIETLDSGSQSPDVMDSLFSRANMDRTNQMRNAEQQQAYLLHQQYMAVQQQYIQWQLAQQSSTTEGMFGPKIYPGKELPEVNSEEQHQERIRFLYQQRQYSKDPASQLLQQPPQTTQARKQDTAETGVSPPPIPEPPAPLSQGYPNVPRFPVPSSPEAIYHQMFLEYMLKFRNNLDPSSIPASQLYNNMMAEIAKQYYQRQTLSKLFHEHMAQSPHFPIPPRSGHNLSEDLQDKTNIHFDPSEDPKLGNNSSAPPRPSTVPPKISPQKGSDGSPSSSKSFNRVHCSSKAVALPKSASFQISRIAADSTSNDDCLTERNPHNTEGNVRDSETDAERTSSNENEITSSRISTSIDSSADVNTESIPESSSEGFNFTRNDEEADASGAPSSKYFSHIPFQFGSTTKHQSKDDSIFSTAHSMSMKERIPFDCGDKASRENASRQQSSIDGMFSHTHDMPMKQRMPFDCENQSSSESVTKQQSDIESIFSHVENMSMKDRTQFDCKDKTSRENKQQSDIDGMFSNMPDIAMKGQMPFDCDNKSTKQQSNIDDIFSHAHDMTMEGQMPFNYENKSSGQNSTKQQSNVDNLFSHVQDMTMENKCNRDNNTNHPSNVDSLFSHAHDMSMENKSSRENSTFNQSNIDSLFSHVQDMTMESKSSKDNTTTHQSNVDSLFSHVQDMTMENKSSRENTTKQPSNVDNLFSHVQGMTMENKSSKENTTKQRRDVDSSFPHVQDMTMENKSSRKYTTEQQSNLDSLFSHVQGMAMENKSSKENTTKQQSNVDSLFSHVQDMTMENKSSRKDTTEQPGNLDSLFSHVQGMAMENKLSRENTTKQQSNVDNLFSHVQDMTMENKLSRENTAEQKSNLDRLFSHVQGMTMENKSSRENTTQHQSNADLMFSHVQSMNTKEGMSFDSENKTSRDSPDKQQSGIDSIFSPTHNIATKESGIDAMFSPMHNMATKESGIDTMFSPTHNMTTRESGIDTMFSPTHNMTTRESGIDTMFSPTHNMTTREQMPFDCEDNSNRDSKEKELTRRVFSPHDIRGNPSPHSSRGNPSPHNSRGNPSPHSSRGNPSPHNIRGNLSPHDIQGNLSPHNIGGNHEKSEAKSVFTNVIHFGIDDKVGEENRRNSGTHSDSIGSAHDDSATSRTQKYEGEPDTYPENLLSNDSFKSRTQDGDLYPEKLLSTFRKENRRGSGSHSDSSSSAYNDSTKLHTRNYKGGTHMYPERNLASDSGKLHARNYEGETDTYPEGFLPGLFKENRRDMHRDMSRNAYDNSGKSHARNYDVDANAYAESLLSGFPSKNQWKERRPSSAQSRANESYKFERRSLMSDRMDAHSKGSNFANPHMRGYPYANPSLVDHDDIDLLRKSQGSDEMFSGTDDDCDSVMRRPPSHGIYYGTDDDYYDNMGNRKTLCANKSFGAVFDDDDIDNDRKSKGDESDSYCSSGDENCFAMNRHPPICFTSDEDEVAKVGRSSSHHNDHILSSDCDDEGKTIRHSNNQKTRQPQEELFSGRNNFLDAMGDDVDIDVKREKHGPPIKPALRDVSRGASHIGKTGLLDNDENNFAVYSKSSETSGISKSSETSSMLWKGDLNHGSKGDADKDSPTGKGSSSLSFPFDRIYCEGSRTVSDNKNFGSNDNSVGGRKIEGNHGGRGDDNSGNSFGRDNDGDDCDGENGGANDDNYDGDDDDEDDEDEDEEDDEDQDGDEDDDDSDSSDNDTSESFQDGIPKKKVYRKKYFGVIGENGAGDCEDFTFQNSLSDDEYVGCLHGADGSDECDGNCNIEYDEDEEIGISLEDFGRNEKNKGYSGYANFDAPGYNSEFRLPSDTNSKMETFNFHPAIINENLQKQKKNNLSIDIEGSNHGTDNMKEFTSDQDLSRQDDCNDGANCGTDDEDESMKLPQKTLYPKMNYHMNAVERKDVLLGSKLKDDTKLSVENDYISPRNSISASPISWSATTPTNTTPRSDELSKQIHKLFDPKISPSIQSPVSASLLSPIDMKTTISSVEPKAIHKKDDPNVFQSLLQKSGVPVTKPGVFPNLNVGKSIDPPAKPGIFPNLNVGKSGDTPAKPGVFPNLNAGKSGDQPAKPGTFPNLNVGVSANVSDPKKASTGMAPDMLSTCVAADWSFASLTDGKNADLLSKSKEVAESLLDPTKHLLSAAKPDTSGLHLGDIGSPMPAFGGSSLPKPPMISLHPGSPRYLQIFFYQHQLLIMQFQQYQFQLQFQFQQLSQQQMSPQQQFLLQNQFHQQMMLLQQQFMQQQAQLHRMAVSGVQFSEHQLNAMYQQQMLTQQTYRQWVISLPTEQQMHLQQRMQHSMQQVQLQMAQILQHSFVEPTNLPETTKPEEPTKKKSTKAPAKSRRPPKKKGLPLDTELIPPKFPVPELSEQMKMHVQRATNLSQSVKTETSLPTSSHTVSLTSQVAKTSETLISSPFMKPKLPIPAPPPPPKTLDTPLDKGELLSKEIRNNNAVINQYKEIEKSFLRQQQEIRNVDRGEKNELPNSFSDMRKPVIAKVEPVSIPKPVGPPKLAPDKFPTHPSQLLHRAKTQGNVDKGMKLPITNSSFHSNDNFDFHPKATLPKGETPSFAARNSLNMMAEEVMRRKTELPEKSLHDEIDSNNQTVISKNFNTPLPKNIQSSFSVSDILRTSDKKLGTITKTSPELPLATSKYNDINMSPKNFETPTNLLESEMRDEKKNLVKVNKKELIMERKRLKELEKQKRMEERARQKILREQKKAERIHSRMLKQKAVQAAKLAMKKKPKVTAPVPTAEADAPERPASPPVMTPPPPPTPKIPLCEPEVHLVYPLVQPIGFNATVVRKVNGAFGRCKVEDVEDPYKEKEPEKPEIDTLNLISEINSVDESGILSSLGYSNVNNALNDENISNIETEKMNDDTITPMKIEETMEVIKEDDEPLKEQTVDESTIKDVDEIAKCEEDNTERRCMQHCNNCFSRLNGCVFYVDKRLGGVTECNLELEELYLTEQLAFCSSDCVDGFQQNLNYDLDNDDIELIDAVKTCAMVTLDKTKEFLPFPQTDIQADLYTYSMDVLKIPPIPEKKHPGWRRWSYLMVGTEKIKPETLQEDINELMEKYNVQLKVTADLKDKRTCHLCKGVGDGETHITSRLLNFNVDTWVHLNCALWSSEVYEAVNGGLHNFDKAFTRSKTTKCSFCHKFGATINCCQTYGAQQRAHCEKTFHFSCAVQVQCGFYKDKTMLCYHHKVFGEPGEELTSFPVSRKVYIERDITKQIARMLHLNNDMERKEYTFRIGKLIFHELGHVPLNLLDEFSTKDYIYPIGFETTTIFWDHHSLDRRRYYTCSISERLNSPRFKVKVHPNGTEVSSYTSCSPKGAWEEIFRNRKSKRQTENLLKFFPEFICGEDLFGLSEHAIQRMLESLPGIDTIPSYNFHFGRTPILIAEIPLALNPTGCSRTEKFRKHHSNRPLAMRTTTEHSHTNIDPVLDDSWLTYSQRTAQMLSTKTGQYRRMRQEWRHNVVLGRSRIQGLGLFVKKDMEENTFIIEYIGSLIRHEVANRLEKHYERQNRGIYMFRIDNKYVVDATMTGGPARYINHSCFPNCVAEIVSIENKKRIIIISNQKIEKGEELTYDYKFEFEDDSNKIACLCGASNCRKWMN